ncbi:phosphoribosylformylglycinamidine synthase subunit PurL [Salinarchaeum sp. IM2453]|uniref:phosphoribosylformylglycinamidine synthase subunit PurL n=1 Tax=Salinarchaeum sp. IM2453 TaxID=2862870 RepID=UPI001C83B728|nr:phosphoribosylformylglycinamidine synthase subunit PurL [Salinarchaeum sp. IM2453]QZA88714.1 phosphoribosylformylglycinamidine synthase subunit PurL [Salinarchaeum sp. IM2453]
MSLSVPDRELITETLGREPTSEEAALFENLWSEHCAYRSSRPLLTAFDSDDDNVVVGPGDDAAVVELPNSETYITMGIESHNHPSYVDPYDGAATGVGGIVRDTMSMGAYPIALADSLYFGDFEEEHSQYLFEGVVEGIADYGNSIGVPTVAGSVDFHSGYEGNPLVNVACVGVTSEDRMLRAAVNESGNKLVLVGNATGRDGLGGASFASEDLSEDAETEDRPAVQVGDPYAEKLLIETNEQLIDEDLVEAARDLGAAGLGGATSEMAAQGDLGAHIQLERVHQREPGMNALEILLAESQERMCYEVTPENVDRVVEVVEKYDLGCSVIGEVADGNYVCTFNGETVVDVPAEFLAEGAPSHDLPTEPSPSPETNIPNNVDIESAFDTIIGHPSIASKEWVYRQYDHEVGTRTVIPPGHDAALLAMHEATAGDEEIAVALSAGSAPNWTTSAPYSGARAVAIENATNLAVLGATPLAAVDCLNGGNPEKPDIYNAFSQTVEGLADGCKELSVPVVGGNVSLYNDSPAGPIPPTPTIAMTGVKYGYETPDITLDTDGEILLVGDFGIETTPSLGGSQYLESFGGSDQFPTLPDTPHEVVSNLAEVAEDDHTVAMHDVSHGGLAVALAEMIDSNVGAEIELSNTSIGPALFHEQPGRAIIQTTDPEQVQEQFDGIAPVVRIGHGTDTGTLSITIDGQTITRSAEQVTELRSAIDQEMT